jgi:hypothetical protein
MAPPAQTDSSILRCIEKRLSSNSSWLSSLLVRTIPLCLWDEAPDPLLSAEAPAQLLDVSTVAVVGQSATQRKRNVDTLKDEVAKRPR